MLRTASLVPLTLTIAMAITGCEQKPEDSPSGSSAAKPAAAVNANIEYQGKSYDLVVLGDCGVRPDGSFGTWAYTLDASGVPISDGPQLHALSQSDWSVIDFYPAIDDRIVRIYREGTEKLAFEDGVLEFEGAMGAGITEQAKVKITCP